MPRSRRRDNIIETVLQACRRDPVLATSGGHKVVVAFSGGPDSSALLHALSRGAASLGLDLLAVHVDHGLRPASAAAAEAASTVAARLGVAVEVHRARLQGGGEDAARGARYRVLEGVAARVRASTIAVGHTADDQAETVLLHLLRGSGLEGLAAMAPREGLRFRPLLGTWREQVEAHCAHYGLEPTHDETNDTTRFARNRVRHELIPLLEAAYNPRAREALLRLAESARDEHAVVTGAARRFLRRHASPYPLAAFNRLEAAVRVEVLRLAWASTAGLPGPAGDAARLRQALEVLAAGRAGMIHLGRGFELLVHTDDFEIRRPDVLTGA